MAPIPSASPLPRLITYFQTHHDSDGNAISVLPLITQPGISLTHLILAAIHINDDPAALTLNDHHPSHPRFQTLWAELRVLQASGIKVMGMLGGAAPGSYQRLDGSAEQFERYYTPVRDLIREHALDGLDLDNLSGFDYEALEVMRGKDIAWYNTQFYCGWGDCSNPLMYNMMRYKGWPPEKLVIGLVTNPENGNGFVPFEMLGGVLNVLGAAHGKQFGGVMGWEYFNSMPGGRERPWEWAKFMTGLLRGHSLEPERKEIEPERKEVKTKASIEVDADSPDGAPPQLPKAFEYHSEGLEED
uniref:Uncharacterized protein n=1 Tax=Bionectria ochroleuca TaxID=29856 RepID=A0A0B7KI72_BIOOC